MTTLGGPNYDNLLVATNDNGLIDYSFIDMTTSKSSNKLVQTLDSGLININLLPTSTTGANNKIPITTSNNVLNNSWLDYTINTAAANKVVVTGSDKLISNNLLNTTDGSTTTESANSSKVVKTTTDGKINDNLLKTTKSGGSANADTIVKLDDNGLLDPSLFRNDQFIPLTGGEPSGNILVIRPGDSANKTLENLKSKYPNFYGFGSSAYTDGFLIGMNGTNSSDNYLVIATLDDGNEPIYVRQYAGSQGYLNMPNNKVNEITLMDKTGYTSVLKLTSANDIISTNGGLSVKSSITSTNGNLSIAGTSTLTGNVTAKGTLSVTGASTFTGKLTANGGVSTTTLTTSSTITSTGKITANGGIGTTSLTTSSNTSIGGTLSVTGNTSLNTLSTSGTATVGGLLTANNRLHIINGYGVRVDSYNNPFLTIASSNSQHLEIDNDEIMSKTNASTAGTLHLQSAGGTVRIGANGQSLLSLNGRFKLDALNASVYSTVYNDAEPIKYMHPKVDSKGNGNVLALGGQGNVIVGGGESAGELYDYTYNTNTIGNNSDGHYGTNTTAYNSDGDNLYLIADSYVYVQTNIQGNYANHKNFTFDRSGNLTIPAQLNSATVKATGNINSGSLDTGPVSASTITATGNITATGKTVTAGNFNGKWGGVINQITTHDKEPDLTRWMLTYVDGYIRYITMSEMADKMKSTINSGIDMSSKAPIPTTSSGVGQIAHGGPSQSYTVPSGGTWEVWADIHNANSTANGSIYKIVSGGTTLDAGWFQTKTNWFAKRIQ